MNNKKCNNGLEGVVNCQNIRACTIIMDRNSTDIQSVWKSIDRMKTWVIMGSGSMMISLGVVLFQYFLNKG